MASQSIITTTIACAIAWAVASTASAQAGFRFGDNDTSYRLLDANRAGDAHFRSMPTFNTYDRTIPNGDLQIGTAGDDGFRPAGGSAQVDRMARDLDHQLKMSYRHNLPEYNRRYVHFRTAMQGWNSSDKTDEDLGNMTQWLKTSMKYSMPGSDGFLPPLPKVNRGNLNSDSTRELSVRDPFEDDPVQMAPR